MILIILIGIILLPLILYISTVMFDEGFKVFCEVAKDPKCCETLKKSIDI